MKKLYFFIFLSLFFSSAGSGAGLLEGKDISFTESYNFYTSYVWRGVLLDADPVMQPSVSVNARNFTATFWSSWDMSNTDQLQSDEKDVSLDYTYNFSYFSASLGNIYYDFSGKKTSSSEYYLGLQSDSLPFTPTLMYYVDYTTRKGSYLSLDLLKTYPVDNKGLIKFSLGVHLGYDDKILIKGQGEDFSLTGDLGLKLTEKLGLSFVAAHSIPFSDLANSEDGNQKSEFYAGIRLGADF